MGKTCFIVQLSHLNTALVKAETGQMWCPPTTRLSGGLDSVSFMVGLDDLKGIFQAK